MNELIEAELNNLKRKTYTELASMNKYQVEKVKKGSKTISISIWKDTLDNNNLRIVVQTYKHLFFHIGEMDADGFQIDEKGNIIDLKREEIYAFI